MRARAGSPYDWGYEVLVREVSDFLHLRHFCGIPLHEPVPDESTVRKLTKRLGHSAVDELIRSLINKASSQRWIRLRAMRCDSTVVEADVKYPTDIGLVGDAVRVLTRTAKKLVAQLPEVTAKVRDRGRAVQTRMRTLSRTLRRRSGEARPGWGLGTEHRWRPSLNSEQQGHRPGTAIMASSIHLEPTYDPCPTQNGHGDPDWGH